MIDSKKIEKVQKFISKLRSERRISLLGSKKIAEFKARKDFANFEIEKEDMILDPKKEPVSRLMGTLTTYARFSYNTLIVRLVRLAYDLDAELAILRQRDVKPEEFQEYNEYVEYCKLMADEYVTIVENLNQTGE